jgi:hypothetical protein
MYIPGKEFLIHAVTNRFEIGNKFLKEKCRLHSEPPTEIMVEWNLKATIKDIF